MGCERGSRVVPMLFSSWTCRSYFLIFPIMHYLNDLTDDDIEHLEKTLVMMYYSNAIQSQE